MTQDAREALAEYAHEAWSGWMRYLFEKSSKGEDGSITIPKEYVANLLILMGQNYDDMPEKSKESDREEADQMLEIVASRKGREEP